MSGERPIDDEDLLGREFSDQDFNRFRTLYQATKAIRRGEKLLETDIPGVLSNREDGQFVEVDHGVVRIWRAFAYGAFKEAESEGLKDVAQAVIRRAIKKTTP